MKILIEARFDTDEGGINFKSRRYEVNNTTDLNEALLSMAEYIEIQIETIQLNSK